MEIIDIEQVILDPPQITAFSNDSSINDINENSNDVNNNCQDINHIFEVDFDSETSEWSPMGLSKDFHYGSPDF